MKSFIITICMITLSLVNAQAQSRKSTGHGSTVKPTLQVLDVSDCNGYFGNRAELKSKEDDASFELYYKKGILSAHGFIYRSAVAKEMKAEYKNGTLTLTEVGNNIDKHLVFVLKHIKKGMFKGYYEYDSWDIATDKPSRYKCNVTVKRYNKPKDYDLYF